MPSTNPYERRLVAEIATLSRYGPGAPNEAEQLQKLRATRLILKSAQARRKASELLHIAAEAEAELAHVGDTVA